MPCSLDSEDRSIAVCSIAVNTVTFSAVMLFDFTSPYCKELAFGAHRQGFAVIHLAREC